MAAAARGIAVPLPQKSVEPFLVNLDRLRQLGCSLPVEVWEAGGELDNETLALLARRQLRHRTLETLVANPADWRGWQIKGAIPSFTAFDELVLMDADVSFARDPSVLFDTQEYQTTGTYFFRDEQSKWVFFGSAGSSKRCRTCQSKSFYNSRKRWLKRLFGETMPARFPPEWSYHWQPGYRMNATKDVMDSGVVVIDRRRHAGMIAKVLELNTNRTETYQHVWGDKETFWLGALLADEPFALASQEATHECCSLLCYRTLRYSRYWRHAAVRGKGTKLRGLIQRDAKGRALFYHRKAEDVKPLSTFALDWNQFLCDRGLGIDDNQVPGFKLGSPVVRAVDHAFLLTVVTLGLIALCAAFLRLRGGMRSRRGSYDASTSVLVFTRELLGTRDEDAEPLLSGTTPR